MDPELADSERRELRRKVRAATLDALRALGGEGRREEIRRRALADGGFTARELTAPPPEAAARKHARMVDYQLAWALTNLKREGLVENPGWSTWRLAGAALEVPMVVAEPVTAHRAAQLREISYQEYLRTPEWRRARAAALERAGYSCSLDVTHTDRLDVHHRTYERLGAELASDLVVLCRACHTLHHRQFGRPRRKPSPRVSMPPPGVPPEAQPPKPSRLRRLLGS